ncbi:hypothetical protein DSLASN_13880 [Desulfoluna limicola]|uniref:Glyoxalase n=1 Tax=Desulfoluna limicola TaxID=2810562 RepID=A0ABN6F1H2_9BACT|nr:hypothetical protein [Desulfoluna limicola]BCS95756.1 hypothetical protein DSLASN_13880 [Desulfoluna limicola]
MNIKGLNFPKVGQVGILVYDCEKTARHYEEAFGIKPWIIFEKNRNLPSRKTGQWMQNSRSQRLMQAVFSLN